MARYRSWSDNDLRDFQELLEQRGIAHRVVRYEVHTDTEVDELAMALGLTRQKDEKKR